MFYAAISAKEINNSFDTKAIDDITKYKIRTDLFPVLTTKEQFDLESVKRIVKEYISGLMVLTSNEAEFLKMFQAKAYKPEMIFDDYEIIERIKAHPMALWKIK